MKGDACPSHCCSRHGCKYGYETCVVTTGAVTQEHPCELCYDEFYDPTVQDLRKALKEGWLYGQDLSSCCHYCGEEAYHDPAIKGYRCDHDAECLMTKYAWLLKMRGYNGEG